MTRRPQRRMECANARGLETVVVREQDLERPRTAERCPGVRLGRRRTGVAQRKRADQCGPSDARARDQAGHRSARLTAAVGC
jgi:hypothetical protein